MIKPSDVTTMAMHTAMEAGQAQTQGATPTAGSQNISTQDPSSGSSTVGQAGGQQQPPAPAPKASQDAKTAAPSGEGYSDPLAKLKSDPEYQKINAELELLTQEFTFKGVTYSVADLIKVIDGDNAGAGDNIIQLSDLQHTAYWQNGQDNLKAFAARILQDPKLNGLLVKLADGYANGTISVAKLTERIATLTTNKETMETAATGAPAPNAPSEATKFDRTNLDKAQEQRAEAKKTGEGTPAPDNQSVDDPTKLRPFTSDKTDPMDRSADAISFMQSEIDRLTTEMTNTQDPGKMKAIEAQITKASTIMQMLMSSMQQQQQLMSNIAKMWSDMAMAAIRNTH